MDITIYSNANSATRSITFDFVSDVLAANDAGPYDSNAACYSQYIKITSYGTQDNGNAYVTKVVRSLSDLALNKQKQSSDNTANAYADVKSMIVDYTYDFIHGHIANQYSSGCTEQRPMKFT